MIRRLSFLLALTFSPLPALAQFTCQSGNLISLHLLPRPHGGADYCVTERLNPSLLCTDAPALVRWRVESTCQGKYTVSIVGEGWKANATGPVPCHPTKDYEGPVNGDEGLVCPLPTAGKLGYRVEVCREGGQCTSTDPGIWVNRGATLAEYDAAESEVKKITFGNEADMLKLSQRKQPPKKK